MTRYADRGKESPATAIRGQANRPRSTARGTSRLGVAMVSFVFLIAILGGVPMTARGQTTVVVYAVADSNTEDGANQFLNFGTVDEMAMGRNGAVGPKLHGFIRFDMSAIPGDVQILNGSLRIYAFDQALGFVDTGFFLVTESWGETTINWTNEPSKAATPDYVYAQDTSEVGAGFHTYEITTLVQSWVDDGNYGMTLQNDTEDEFITWATREDTFNRETRLTITYQPWPFAVPDYFGLGAALAAIITAMGFFNLILRPKKDRDLGDVIFFLILVAILVIALGAWLATR